MVNEDAALLNRRVTRMTPAALFSRRLHRATEMEKALFPEINPELRRCIFHKVATSDMDDVLQEIKIAIVDSIPKFKKNKEKSFLSSVYPAASGLRNGIRLLG